MTHTVQAAEAPNLRESGDERAIAELHAAFEAQKQAFAADRSPTLAERRSRIERLMAMVLAKRKQIAAAVAEDFGSHPVGASDLIEVLGVLGRARYVLDHLEQWMRPLPRETDPAMLGTGRAFIQSQPKGVIGNIVPWNFPFDIALGPMIEMLAAGNRVIVKPSDYTPSSAALLREMVSETFDPNLVYVAVGGLPLARRFTALPWDHLLYTGSPEVGRQVMAAAAPNLTPVTLELGGKCPVVMTTGSVTPSNVSVVIGTKTVKNGQMCITPDHCLIPRDEVQQFVDLAKAHMTANLPNYSRSDDCTGIISFRHLDRLSSLLDEARSRGCRIVPLESDGVVDRARRRMPMYMVIDPPPDLRLMREEIFGPILPVISYDTIDEAIARINAGERPLGVYVFGEKEDEVNLILDSTTSGGASINACAIQGALPSLAFGGVGMSGMGRHHGEEGFREFSNQRGIVTRGTGDHIEVFCAPYGNASALVDAALGST